MRFHINPATGNPNKCRAKVGNCPFKDDNGEEKPHYATKEEAKVAAEAENAKAHGGAVAPAVKKEVPQRMQSWRQIPAMVTRRKKLAFGEEKSFVQCPECLHNLSNGLAAEITVGDGVGCPACGEFYIIDDAAVDVSPEYSDIVADTRAVLSRPWTHMTLRGENWHGQVVENKVDTVHVGDPAAAVDRIVSCNEKKKDDEVVRIFTVNFTGDHVRVAGEIMDDTDHSYFDVAELSNGEEVESLDVVPYVNRWENPGSISLELRPQAITVAHHETTTMGELRKKQSLYNLYDILQERHGLWEP